VLDDEQHPVQLSPLFLMEILELREALAELSGSDAHNERSGLICDIQARYEALLGSLGEGLDTGAELDSLLQSAAQLRYLARVLEEFQSLEENL